MGCVKVYYLIYEMACCWLNKVFMLDVYVLHR